jgi:two-component system chemotaxis response regulator CheY
MGQVLAGSVDDCEIVEAENGKEAVAKAHELRPDLVIVDLMMPLIDGLTASREITKLLPNVPILMHTLYSSPQVEVEAGRVGIRKVVPKSESRILVSAVQEILLSKLPTTSAAASEPASADMVMATRRAEDKIQELCAELFAMGDDKGHESIFLALRDALHQHIEHLRARVAEYPVVVERRIRNGVPPRHTRAQENAAKETLSASDVAPTTAATPGPSGKGSDLP